MGKVRTVLRRLSIKHKIFLCIILLSLAPQCFLVAHFFESSKATLVDTTQRDIYQLVRVNNELINQQLTTVREATMNILVDADLYEIFSEANFGDVVDQPTAEKSIHKVLMKYFGSLNCVQQVDIITRPYTYAMNTRVAQYKGFFESDPYKRIAQRDGGIVWLNRQEMAPFQLSRTYLSCARLLNLVYVDISGIGKPLPKDYERAVIRVLFSDDFFTERLQKSIANLSDAEYYLMDQSGEVLLSGGDYASFVMRPEWWAQIRESGSGMLKVNIKGREQAIICYDRLSQPGWMSLAVFSVDTLADGLTKGLNATFIGVVFVQVLASVLATLLAISMVSKRIKRVNQGVDSLKAGNFATQITDNRQDEFTYLVQNFNGMSATLRRLIDENFKVRLSEQEARLQTLMMQFNPHFLYNTLNVINWVALRGNTKKASALIVSLSRMLRYTCDNRQDRTRFSDDIAWLRQYLTLMEARFEGLFTVEWDIEEECLPCELPKLFMQPLLENSILHGFGDRKQGGRILIRAWIEGDDVLCEVMDNGVGMTRERAERVLMVEGESIGLYNTNKRIALMFGDGYGLSIQSEDGGGCTVRVRMRVKSNEQNKTQGY